MSLFEIVCVHFFNNIESKMAQETTEAFVTSKNNKKH